MNRLYPSINAASTPFKKPSDGQTDLRAKCAYEGCNTRVKAPAGLGFKCRGHAAGVPPAGIMFVTRRECELLVNLRRHGWFDEIYTDIRTRIEDMATEAFNALTIVEVDAPADEGNGDDEEEDGANETALAVA